MANCPKCGVRVAKAAIFCRKCGFNLEVEEPQVEESEKAQSEVSTPEGKCDNHPERDAVDTCIDCGKGICFFCRTVLKGNDYCPACIDKVLSELRADESDEAHTEPSIPDIKCPLCGSPTFIRTLTKGSNAGSKFYMCLHYPDCEGKVAYDSEAEHRRPPSPEGNKWLDFKKAITRSTTPKEKFEFGALVFIGILLGVGFIYWLMLAFGVLYYFNYLFGFTSLFD